MTARPDLDNIMTMLALTTARKALADSGLIYLQGSSMVPADHQNKIAVNMARTYNDIASIKGPNAS